MPASTASSEVPSAASPAPLAAPSSHWRQALAGWIAAHKSYPDPARQSGIEGTVALRFTIDRSGRVVSLELVHSSGSRVLDFAAEDMLRNASLPPPDPAQDRVTVSVHLHYALTDQ